MFEAFESGRSAYQAGNYINPYSETDQPELAEAWNDGWWSARDDRQRFRW
jgi:hypothetical protein